MTDIFAFDVAVIEPETEVLGHYDPEQQQFVWAGDGDVGLSALCSRTASGWYNCSSTGTACNFSRPNCVDADLLFCYRCDF